MSGEWSFYLTFFSGAAGCGYLAYLLLDVTPEKLPLRERWTRNKPLGMILAYVAFIVCVPYAEVVSPDFLIPLLWPLALVMPVVCALYVDYPTARAVGGLLILLAYLVVHDGFELVLPLAPALSVVSWAVGIAGIWLSAQPWKLRDLFRSSATVRRCWAALLILYALFLAGEGVWHLF